MDDGDLYGFVEHFRRLVELAHERIPPDERPSPLLDRLSFLSVSSNRIRPALRDRLRELQSPARSIFI